MPQTPTNKASYREKAFFAQIAALNVMFESARTGKQAQDFCREAQSCSELLVTFLLALKAEAL